MSYLALYRKYRPRVFEDVVGQDHIVRTLQNQIKTGRVSHAYLFSGSRGTGKTSIAKIFASSVNCLTPINGSACMEREACQKIEAGASMNIIEIVAASHNVVDNIREINEEVKYSPAVGKYKLYIIDEVHMLSTGAFNALLKTLEEPPAHIIFILATTDPQKIPVTILSRCQRFDFKRISAIDIENRLIEYMAKEQIDIEDQALAYIARLADGRMRDALSILEQCISFYFDERITVDKVLYLVGAVDTKYLFEMLEAISNYDSNRAIEICDEVNMQGRSIRQFNSDLLVHTRNLLVAKTTNQTAGVLDYSGEYVELLTLQARLIEVHTLMRYIKSFSELDNDLKIASNQKVILEVAIIKMCEPAMDQSEEALLDKIAALEAKIEKIMAGGISVSANIQANNTSVSKEPAKVITPTRLPDAVPEEVKAVKDKWPEIMRKLGIGARLTFGSTAPGVIEGDTLYIVHGVGMEIGVGKYLEELKSVIREVIGREVKVAPMASKIYQSKTTEVYGSHPEKTDTTLSIEDTLKDIQSKLNYDITMEN